MRQIKLKTHFFFSTMHSGDEGKVQVKDGEAESIEVQHDKEEKMSKDNNSADVDESCQINITTTKDISSSMNQINDYISAESMENGMYSVHGVCCSQGSGTRNNMLFADSQKTFYLKCKPH